MWPQFAAQGFEGVTLKQLDSVDELLAATPANEPAVIVWDARGCTDPAAMLTRLQAHSPRFAIIALDQAGSAAGWGPALEQRHIVALLPMPLDSQDLAAAIAAAREVSAARAALPGGGAAKAAGATIAGEPAAGPRIPWRLAAGLGAALLLCAVAFVHFRHQDTTPKAAATPGASSAVNVEEQVDTLIGRAQQAMLDRHFIDPAQGSALSLYRNALRLDPASGEARQGLQRLAEILIARVQSAMDEKKFDAALQALETARSIDPSDSRLASLDERIASLRAELGPADIQAAINAENFDRAAQLIEEAVRAKSIAAPKISQLQEDLRRRRVQTDSAHFVSLLDARLQQDRLIDPHNDSAAYYYTQARQAGAGAAMLQTQWQDLTKRLVRAARSAIDQHHAAEAERIVGELRALGAPAAVLSGLQHDMGTAGPQAAPEAGGRTNYAQLAKARLAQGSVLEPDNDSAYFYLTQLRSAEPQNAELAPLSSAVQAQVLEQVRAALEAGQSAKAQTLLQQAGTLGNSADLDALSERLRVMKLVAAGQPIEVPEGELTRTKKLEIEYPGSALSHKVEGTVNISYTVTPKGTVADIKVIESNPPGVFEKAASDAVSHLRYKPYLQNGKPIAVVTRLRVTFRVAS